MRAKEDQTKSREELLEELQLLRSQLDGIAQVRSDLLESEQRLADIIDFLPDATFAINLKGEILFWNRAMELMTGYSADSMIGKGNHEYSIPFYGNRRPMLIDLIFKSDEELKNKYQYVNKVGNSLLAEAEADAGAHFVNTRTRYLWGKASPLYDSNGNIVGAIESIRDITDKKETEKERERLEAHLRRAEKMEALGSLAGGVAHDLNNVVGVITGYTELILHGERENNELRFRLLNILKSGKRAAAIVQDLLTLARRGVLVRKIINLNSLISEILDSPEFIKIISHNPQVNITHDFDDSLFNISASPIHFEKSLFNLISNGIEAITGAGEISITTQNTVLKKPIEGYDKIVPGDYVVLSISDNGEGISEKDMKHIFEPFYTKKVMGKSGTGLGLAVVWGTVSDHLGYIRVDSKVGSGTTFSIYIPASTKEISNPKKARDLKPYHGSADVKILVVDDVKDQGNMAAEILTSLKYSVETVSSGEDAVAFVRKAKVDLLIIDMIMFPGMDGLDTYKEILKVHPTQKAIIISGYAETERVFHAQSLGAGIYLRKPYTLEQIGKAVRDELNR